MMVVASVAVMGLATSALAQAAGPKGGGGLQQGGKAQGGQRQGGMRMMGGGRFEEQILPKLKLSADQKKKWDAVNKDMQAEMEKIRASMQKAGGAQTGQGQGQRPRMSEADRTKLQAKFKAFNDKKMAILTKDQKATYEKEMKAAREKFMKERGGQRGGGGAAGGKTGGKGGGGF